MEFNWSLIYYYLVKITNKKNISLVKFSFPKLLFRLFQFIDTVYDLVYFDPKIKLKKAHIPFQYLKIVFITVDLKSNL